MSGTRFARSGRCRFFVCMGVMVLMFGIIAIFHSSQQQLDKSREQHIRCEQQQDALNEQLQTAVEEKYKLKKTHENEINEQLQSQKNLEQKYKELKEQFTKNQIEERDRYEKLQQSHKNLQNKHTNLLSEYTKISDQHLQEQNTLEREMKILRSNMVEEKNRYEEKLNSLREKYDAIIQEKDRLEGLLNAADSKNQLHRRVTELEHLIVDYKSHCNYRPAQPEKSPLKPPDTIQSDDRPIIQKSFDKEEVVSPGFYHIPIRSTNITKNVNTAITNNIKTVTEAILKNLTLGGGDNSQSTKSHGNHDDIKDLNIPEVSPTEMSSFIDRNNRSLILNSVENFQILPKPIQKVIGDIEPHEPAQPENTGARPVLPLNPPRKVVSSTEASASKVKRVISKNDNDNGNMMLAHLNRLNTSSTANLPPLQQPPNQKKLPDNVAPIPANFDELLQQQDTVNQRDLLKLTSGDAADNNAAEEGIQKNDNDDGTNNRYANVVKDLVNKGHKPEGNDDSGAHEVKDQEFLNDQNFNLPPEDDNFFDNGKNDDLNGDKQKHDNSEDDLVGAIGGGGAGDIAVKNRNQMLDDNLNNEIAGDQGKELPEGLQMEEGIDDDGDEDDYSNPAARQQGAQAIRN